MMRSEPEDKRSRHWWKIGEYASCAVVVVWLLLIVGFLDFKRYQPPKGTTTIDQLVAELPETFKLAIVKNGVRSSVVWIGRPRGMIASGPPVWVFDETGNLVDRVYDVGEVHNTFVHGLYRRAFEAPAISPQEALDYCHGSRAAPHGSGVEH
jgi:hypothetical protein